MEIREYEEKDCAVLAQLFYDTVHTVNLRDYTVEQADAWADGTADLDEWNQSLLSHRTLVAVKGGTIVGFGDMDWTGYLDRLYVHKDHQGQGVATAICDRLERESDADSFTTHSSITARPFFERRGYRALCAQTVSRNGVEMTNYVMVKKDT